MGLDAFVKCNCLKEGKVTEPPLPWDALRIDEDGWIELIEAEQAYKTMPHEEYWSKYGEALRALDRWEQHACEHEDMRYCQEWVGNWALVARFQTIVQSLGEENFPILSTMLPDANGGSFPCELAEVALAELELLDSKMVEAAEVCLVDAKTKRTVFTYIPDWEGLFMFSPNQRIGVDERGLFVIDLQTNKEVFRSMHIRQMPYTDEMGQEVALLTCLDTGVTQTIFSCIGDKAKKREMRVITKSVTPLPLHVAEVLKRLLNASIATGNPIYWT